MKSNVKCPVKINKRFVKIIFGGLNLFAQNLIVTTHIKASVEIKFGIVLRRVYSKISFANKFRFLTVNFVSLTNIYMQNA